MWVEGGNFAYAINEPHRNLRGRWRCGGDAGDRLRVTREYTTVDVFDGDKHEARHNIP